MDAESIQSTDRTLENLELCELFILTVLEVSVYLALKILKTNKQKKEFLRTGSDVVSLLFLSIKLHATTTGQCILSYVKNSVQTGFNLVTTNHP